MTSPDRFTTDKTFSPSTIHSLQQKSKEAEALQAHSGTIARMDSVGNSFLGNILSGFASIGAAVGQALNDIANALFGGLIANDHPALDKIRDGQLDLIARMDDVSGYAVAYMMENRFKKRRIWNRMEFNGAIIRNPKNATYVDNGIQLAAGTWFIDAQITHDHHVNRRTSQIRIVVTRPDGSVFSIKESHNEVNPDKYTTLSVRHSVSVPTGGYRVHVWAYYMVGDTFGIYNQILYRGGTALSHLMVDRINLDATESNVNEAVPTVGAESDNDG